MQKEPLGEVRSDSSWMPPATYWAVELFIAILYIAIAYLFGEKTNLFSLGILLAFFFILPLIIFVLRKFLTTVLKNFKKQ